MIPNVPALSVFVMRNPLTLSNTSSGHGIGHRLPKNLLRLLLEETRRPVPAVLVMSSPLTLHDVANVCHRTPSSATLSFITSTIEDLYNFEFRDAMSS